MGSRIEGSPWGMRRPDSRNSFIESALEPRELPLCSPFDPPGPVTGGYLTIVGRTVVRPDSVQVLDGMLSWRLPTSMIGVAL